MADITPEGVASRTMQQYTSDLQERFLQALNLTDLNFDVETPQGQLISVLAAALARIDQEMIDLYGAGSLLTAVGQQLDGLVALFSIYRLPARVSTATLTFTGSAGTQVPTNTSVRSSQGDLFTTTEVGTIAAGATTVDIPVSSIETGRIFVGANSINDLVSGVAGITAVTNASEGVIGRDVETDSQLRNRFVLTAAANSFGSVDAIRANVLRLGDVEFCVVRDNPSASEITVGTTAIAAYSVLVVVEGGEDEDVAEAILRKKPAGTPTVGTTSVESRSISGVIETVRFTRVAPLPVAVTLTIDTDASYAGATTQLIIQALVDYVDRLGPGEVLDEDRAKAEVLGFEGFDIDSIVFTQVTGGAALPTTVDITNRLTLAASDVTITIA